MRRSSNPLIGPTLTPWSIGTMMALPVVRLNIRSSRTDFPISMCKDNSGEIIKIVHNLSPQATPRLRQSEPRSIMDPCRYSLCLLYTSDAADDLLCVDLGGRRIIKKKKK